MGRQEKIGKAASASLHGEVLFVLHYNTDSAVYA